MLVGLGKVEALNHRDCGRNCKWGASSQQILGHRLLDQKTPLWFCFPFESRWRTYSMVSSFTVSDRQNTHKLLFGEVGRDIKGEQYGG